MFFADFSVNSQRFWWNFVRTSFVSCSDCRKIFIKKYLLVQKLDHLTCSEFVITTSLYKPIKLVKLKFVFSPEVHYIRMVQLFSYAIFSDENFTVVAAWLENSLCKISWKSVENREIGEKHAIQVNLTAGIEDQWEVLGESPWRHFKGLMVIGLADQWEVLGESPWRHFKGLWWLD